ncbi:MAG TPA: hypothetical protein VGD23_09500 [Sphingomicrobium sp.]
MARVALLLLTLIGYSTPALACRDEPELELSWLSRADLVIVGRVSNYRITPDFNDPVAARVRYDLLERALAANPEEREAIRRNIRSASDYAHLDVQVEEVLVGTVPERLEVTWDTSWFRLPDRLEPGLYLIALQAPGKGAVSPARARSWTVLSPICEQSFLIPSGRKDAVAIRQQLESN